MFPTKGADLGLPILIWKREVVIAETVHLLRTQVAKNRQNLTDDFGFVLEREPTSSSGGDIRRAV